MTTELKPLEYSYRAHSNSMCRNTLSMGSDCLPPQAETLSLYCVITAEGRPYQRLSTLGNQI